nr:hypothetical protein NG677_23205 [Methylobacterium sp. OTU13CASTA1]
MTNHVTTRCTVRGLAEAVAAFRALMVVAVDPPRRPALASPVPGLLARLRGLVRGRVSDAAPPLEPPLLAMDFNRILPMPASLTAYPEQTTWLLEHWGTQRNAESYTETAWHRDGTAVLEFCIATAWSFPAPVFAALHGRFPTLSFDIVGFEEAWQFAVAGIYGPGETGAVEVEPTADLYARVYGVPPEPGEEA